MSILGVAKYRTGTAIGQFGRDVRIALENLGDQFHDLTVRLGDKLCMDCAHCGKPTYARCHYYMVFDYVWRIMPKHYQPCQLCLDCLELHLDRKLTIWDFDQTLPVNAYPLRVFFNEEGLYDPEREMCN